MTIHPASKSPIVSRARRFAQALAVSTLGVTTSATRGCAAGSVIRASKPLSFSQLLDRATVIIESDVSG
ncbi:MAG: hypothetical protein ACKVPX_02470, partial [Myxococcaceae bacterium]